MVINKMTFTIVNTDKPCRKRNKARKKAFTKQSISVANELMPTLKTLFD